MTIGARLIKRLSVAAAAGLSALAASPANAQNSSEAAALTAFAGSGYTFCDAKKVAKVWGGDFYDGKIKIGDKVSKGRDSAIDQAIASTASSVECSWSELQLFQPEDAEKLAKSWNLSVEKAKAKAAGLASSMGGKKFKASMGLE